MRSRAAASGPGALSLLERAFHLLRRQSGAALAEYYLGSLPFVLALLYFWSDMSRDPSAALYCGPSAAILALAFIWMKLWQVRFCRRVLCRLQNTAAEPWSWTRLAGVAARQAFMHAVGFVALALAAVVALPLGWVYAFFQNLSVLEEPGTRRLQALVQSAREQAVLWPGQNHLALGIMSLFSFFVFFNLALGVLAVPYLLKWILGIETVFTLSGLRLLNTTFLAVLFALTYLCVDPVLKTLYVLRCFYGLSRQTGEDLRAALRPFLHTGLVVCLFWAVLPSRALALETAGDAARPVITRDWSSDAQQLDRSIETVLQQRRFAWRLPRPAASDRQAAPGWISSTIQWIGDGFKALGRPLRRWFKAIIDWFDQHLPKPKRPGENDGPDYRGVIRWIFYALGFALVLLLGYALVRWLVRSRAMPTPVEGPTDAGRIDLADERLTARDLPLDQWLDMARELMARNDLRHGLRALYLSILAVLADHQRVTIARYKSNQDYARELARHAHAEPELLTAFNWCVRLFERTWYGMHPVARGQVDEFMNRQQRISALVQRIA
jgi:hypothetical protein